MDASVSGGEGRASSPAGSTAHAQGGADDPRVSRSAGTPGGLLVLWPRVVPGQMTEGDDARLVQQALVELVRKEMPNLAMEVRPAPERVCPQRGCLGRALGAVLVVHEDTCALAVLASEAGASTTRILPVHGGMQLKRSEVPFRDPPESELVIADYAACSGLRASIDEKREEILALLRP